ncbi:hypothetical protein ACWGHM_34565 [Streptomyces sp. NPDC054904]
MTDYEAPAGPGGQTEPAVPLFDRMAGRWRGDRPVAHASVMVRTLAPEMARPADWNEAKRYEQPVLLYLMAHGSPGWRSYREIGSGCGLGSRHAAELLMCLNALVDAGHLVEGPESHFSFGVPNILGLVDRVDALRDPSGRHRMPVGPEMAEVISPGGERDQALALLAPLRELFAREGTGFEPALADICEALGSTSEADLVVLHLALGALAFHGQLRMLPSVDESGPRWALPVPAERSAAGKGGAR